MKRISVSFYDEVFSKLEQYAAEKKISTAQGIREMVDIGLRVQEISSKKVSAEEDKNIILEKLEEIKFFLKKDLISNCESLSLMRYTVSNLPDKETDEINETLQTARVKSQAYVEGLAEKK